MFADLWQDLGYGLRTLRKNPGFTFVAVLTLALGIGANTALFSVVNSVLLQPLPFGHPERLILLSSANEKKGWTDFPIPPGAYVEFRDQNRTLEGFAVFAGRQFTLTGGDEPWRVRGARISADLLPLLGGQPVQGRGFLPEEDVPGAPKVALIGQGLWQRYFGADPAILGKTVQLNEGNYTIVGVMPSDFPFPSQETEVWVPLQIEAGAKPWDSWFLTGLGRLKPGVSQAQAQAEFGILTEQFEDKLPFGGGWTFRFKSLIEETVGEVRAALLVLFGAVGFVFLIACVNVANLLLSRVRGRQLELAVRTALGATRQRLTQQLLTESLLLSLLGGTFGLLFAYGGTVSLLTLLPGDFPRFPLIGFDPVVFAFAVAASVLTVLLSGLLPAWQATRTNQMTVIRGGSQFAAGGRPGSWARTLLVVAEVALSVVLLVGAGLLINSFVRLMQIESGFDSGNVITMRLNLPRTRYARPEEQIEFLRELTERAAAIPSVRFAGATTGLPLRGVSMIDSSLKVEGPAAEPVVYPQPVATDAVTTDYFQSLGIPLLRGRFFSPQDTAAAPLAVIINEVIARRYFSQENPIGRRILATNDKDRMTVVGVVGNVKQYGLEKDTPLQMYIPFSQHPGRSFYVTVKNSGRPELLVPDLKKLIHSMDATLPITRLLTLEEVVSDSVSQRRLNTLLMSSFGVLALVLAAVGVYGVIAFSVTQRTHEMGIRMALGAGRGNIFGLVIGQGMRMALIGLVVGLGGAIALSRYLESLLFGVTATDPVAFGGSVLVLLAVAFLACYIPARRATKVDPMVALRYE